jgi:type II secretory pathway component HofQ
VIRNCALALSLFLASCSGTQGERAHDGDFNGAVASWDANPRTDRAESASIASATGVDNRTTARSIRRRQADTQHRPHVVDARFDDADLVNALRFLADEAGLNLVVGPGVAGTVNDQLDGVDAYRAMLVIARAHGATVERQGQVVIVRGD